MGDQGFWIERGSEPQSWVAAGITRSGRWSEARSLKLDSQVAGHAWATIKRVAKVLGVAKGKDGTRSVWRLPEDREPSQLTLASDAA